MWAEISYGGGCRTRDSIQLTLTDCPFITAITATPVVAGSTQYSLSAVAVGNPSYTRVFGANGATGSGSSIIYTYPANGTFTLRLIVKNNCGADTAYKTIVTGNGQNTGIGNAVNKDEVNIYPNPTSQSITINLAQGSIKSYRIIAANGAVVKEDKLPGNVMDMVVDISRLAAGIYTLQLQTGDGVVTRQIEISR